MKSRSKSRNKKLIARVRKLRGRLPADVDVVQEVREVRESPRQLPTRRARQTKSASAPGVNPLSNRSTPDAAGRFKRPTDAPGKRGGILKALRRAPPIAIPQRSWPAKSRYITLADLLADLPPPEIARKLRLDDRAPYTAGHWAWVAPRGWSWVNDAPRGFVADVHKKTRRRAVDVESTVANWNRFAAEHGSFVEGLSYSDHGFRDVFSVTFHALAARKILDNPLLIEKARSTLERWISRQAPAPRALLEWRDILAGTPQQIAAVAMSLTEEATRLRSSSPLTVVLARGEKSAIYGVFGKTTPEAHRAEVLSIASKMKAQGLPDPFIVRAIDLSQEFEGILRLMRMWRDEAELSKREATVATIQELINDCAQVEVSKPLIGAAPRAEALGAFLADWEHEHGAFTGDELRTAAAAIEGPKPRTSSSAGKAGKPKKFVRILAQAIKTFGSKDAAKDWLNSRVMGLGMKRPIDLMSTTEGAQLVEDLLGRIDAGVYT